MHESKSGRPSRRSALLLTTVVMAIACDHFAALAKDHGYTVIYTFGQNGDANQPKGGLLRDTSGNLFGTTVGGGSHNKGAVFELAADGSESVLYSFCSQENCDDGQQPLGALIEDGSGDLFGTTSEGGDDAGGVAFEVPNNGAEKTLFQFGPTTGEEPTPTLVRDSEGNLYGTDEIGDPSNMGLVFQLTSGGTENVLYDFSGTNGENPEAGLIMDKSGNLYGTTSEGGAYGYGEVFELAANGSEYVLYSFTGGTDGRAPVAPVTMDAAGNLYGTTYAGGHGSGVVFELAPNGTETVLYTFAEGDDGGQPENGVILDKQGNLYGTTGTHGASGDGVVFRIDRHGGETVLHTFTGGSDGANPGPLIWGAGDKKNFLYGMCMHGGYDNEDGLIFMLKK
ncbi:MAG TPA: choice-of-anchor tandem repeat GloVer-containing protein [Rhizomicrobium sp.]|nr:choice-of-anchor tandem repeat GloVer-containing protein [Rhizomicrobium sp.]